MIYLDTYNWDEEKIEILNGICGGNEVKLGKIQEFLVEFFSVLEQKLEEIFPGAEFEAGIIGYGDLYVWVSMDLNYIERRYGVALTKFRPDSKKATCITEKECDYLKRSPEAKFINIAEQGDDMFNISSVEWTEVPEAQKVVEDYKLVLAVYGLTIARMPGSVAVVRKAEKNG